MPIYDYKCPACARSFEGIVKHAGDTPDACWCGNPGENLERLPSAPAIAFRGGGWYADGYSKPVATKEYN